jgi:hypothetical protein
LVILDKRGSMRGRRGNTRAFLFWSLLTLLIASCAAGKVRPVAGPEGKPPVILAFVEDGTTSRDEVQQQLGAPASSFDQERILAYRLDEDFDLTDALPDASYSLIFVFDGRGVLQRHSLVRIR